MEGLWVPMSWMCLVVILALWSDSTVVEGKKNSQGQWGPWGSWSPCSSTCGPGTIELKREWIPTGNVRQEQPYTTTKVLACTNKDFPNCPVNGRWSGWTSWSDCTKPCGQGTKNRTRQCRGQRYGGDPCEGKNEMSAPCKRDPCPVLPRNFQMSQCTTKNFTCASNKMCIRSSQKCDDTVQCHDGSDEIGCPRKHRWVGGVKYDLSRGTATSLGMEKLVQVLAVSIAITALVVKFQNLPV